MAQKQKNQKSAMDAFSDGVRATGVILMTAAVTLGLTEVPTTITHEEKRAVLPQRPVYAFPGSDTSEQTGNTLRREREETGPHYVSYSTYQRTPGRTKGI